MAKNVSTQTGSGASVAPRTQPNCLAISKRGINTSRDFAAMMSALMSDIIEDRIEPRAANAVCNAGGKLLKIVEMEQRYGSPSKQPEEKILRLSNASA